MKGTSFSLPSQQRELVNVVSSTTEPGAAVSFPFLPIRCDVTGELVHKTWLAWGPLLSQWQLDRRYMTFLQGCAVISPESHSERQDSLSPPTGLNQHSPKSVSWKLWIAFPVAIPTIRCLLNASSLSLSPYFIACTLLRNTGRHSLRGMPWPLSGFCSHISQRVGGYVCELANHPSLTANILHICQQMHNNFSNLDLFVLFFSSVLLWQKNSHPPTYPEIANVDRRKGRW